MLNNDTNLCILCLLDDESLNSMCTSNKYFNQLCQNNSLWYCKIKLLYPTFNITLNTNYKFIYYNLKLENFKLLLTYAKDYKDLYQWLYHQKYINDFGILLDKFMESLNFCTSETHKYANKLITILNYLYPLYHTLDVNLQNNINYVIHYLHISGYQF